MAISIDVGSPTNEPDETPIRKSRGPRLLNYRDEILIDSTVCPICGAAIIALLKFPRNAKCERCGMWESQIRTVSYDSGIGVRICLVEIAFNTYGDSKRKQNARIKKRDAAIKEAKYLWEYRETLDVFKFGEISPEDWQTVLVMADALKDANCPLNEAAARSLAHKRQHPEQALPLPELKFKPPKGASGEDRA